MAELMLLRVAGGEGVNQWWIGVVRWGGGPCTGS